MDLGFDCRDKHNRGNDHQNARREHEDRQNFPHHRSHSHHQFDDLSRVGENLFSPNDYRIQSFTVPLPSGAPGNEDQALMKVLINDQGEIAG